MHSVFQGTSAPFGIDYNLIQQNCQVSVNDEFLPRKTNNLILADSYKRLGRLSKSERVKNCGDFLEFKTPKFQNGGLGDTKLSKANFCRDRLCPLCSWRKSKKMFAELSQVISKLGSEYEYLFLTLTVPNCWGEDLQKTVDLLFKSFDKLRRKKEFKNAIIGYFRALEVTICDGSFSPDLVGSYHPHFHCLLAVKSSYFKKNFITQQKWLEMWRSCTGINEITQVDIRKVKLNDDITDKKNEITYFGGIKELTKYATKDAGENGYLVGSDAEIDKKVGDLSFALSGRRLVQYGGVMKKAFAELGFKSVDDETTNLCDDLSEISPVVYWLVCRFRWGIGCYDFIELEKQFNEKILDIEYSED